MHLGGKKETAEEKVFLGRLGIQKTKNSVKNRPRKGRNKSVRCEVGQEHQVVRVEEKGILINVTGGKKESRKSLKKVPVGRELRH